MTDKEHLKKERLENSLQICRTHLQRMNYAARRIEDFFPLTLDQYLTLGEAKIGNIDQMIFRFIKLQDEMGTNTFRLLLDCLQEDTENKPFKDILNLLERFRIIEQADLWLALRELRNDLTHDYPQMVDETIDKLNHLFQQIPLIEKILNRLINYELLITNH